MRPHETKNMKTTKLILLAVLFDLSGVLLHAASLGMAFTYQGRLVEGGQAANGLYDLGCTLYDAASEGRGEND